MPLTHQIHSAPAAPSSSAARRPPSTAWRSSPARAWPTLDRLPFSIRVLLENALRYAGRGVVTEEHVRQLGGLAPAGRGPERDPVHARPGGAAGLHRRALRGGSRRHARRHGPDGRRPRPDQPGGALRPGDRPLGPGGLTSARSEAFQLNVELEFERNVERYQLLKFAQRAFRNFRVVPPGTGIVHQVNLEYLAPVVQLREQFGELTAYPDTLVGTDSHTTMINGLGVVGWGVGGIEAEAVMLGQPYFMLIPEVVGMKLTGELPLGTTATDLVLTVTQMLRKKGVVDKFVEFYGPGLSRAGAGRPGHDRQHGPGVRRHDGLLPGGRRDAALPGADRPRRRRGPAGRALLQGAGAVPHRRRRPTRCSPPRSSSTSRRSCRAWPAPSGRRTWCRSRSSSGTSSSTCRG